MRITRLGARTLVVAVALLLLTAGAALGADGRDPRCAEWERSGPPPGIDMLDTCPSVGVTTAAVDLDSEPLMPWIVALLVVAGVLTLFGLVAMRFTATPARPRGRPADWWTCAACRSRNTAERTACFACHASRSEPAPPHPA